MGPLPGVQMNTPPAQYITQTTSIIQNAVAQLGADEKGALVWVASRSAGKTHVNLALVHRVNDRFAVTGWVGKTWGQPIEAGIAGRIDF